MLKSIGHREEGELLKMGTPSVSKLHLILVLSTIIDVLGDPRFPVFETVGVDIITVSRLAKNG